MAACAHFFWCEVVRRVQRKAPTTTTIMVNAPTEMMMTMTKIWLSPLPVIPGLPTQRHRRATVNLLHHWKAGVCVCVCVYVYIKICTNSTCTHLPIVFKTLELTVKTLRREDITNWRTRAMVWRWLVAAWFYWQIRG